MSSQLDTSWIWSGSSSSSNTTASTSSSSSTPSTSKNSPNLSPTTTTTTVGYGRSSSSTMTATTPTCTNATTPTRSKSDAFFNSSFSSFNSLPPLKPPSPIAARRASESCLPPPCAAVIDATSSSGHGHGHGQGRRAGSFNSGTAAYRSRLQQHHNPRDRFSSLPDIREYGSSSAGLGIVAATSSKSGLAGSPPPARSGSNGSLSNASSSQSTPTPTLGSGGGDDNCEIGAYDNTVSAKHSRNSSIDDIEARLSSVVDSITGQGRGQGQANSQTYHLLSTPITEEDDEEEEEEDMYNDVPSTSTSTSSTSKVSTSRRGYTSTARRKDCSFFEDDDDDDGQLNNHNQVYIESVPHISTITASLSRFESANENEEYDDDNEDSIFEPCYPLDTLAIIHTPQHRIRRSRSLKRALSDSCTIAALDSNSKKAVLPGSQTRLQVPRKVSFCNEVQVVDVFSAIDYPARRGPPPLERLSMRDVLELRQIKLELGAYMGDEKVEPESESGSETKSATGVISSKSPIDAKQAPPPQPQTLHSTVLTVVDDDAIYEDAMDNNIIPSYESSLSSISLEPSTSTSSSVSSTSMSSIHTTISTSSSDSVSAKLGSTGGLRVDLDSLLISPKTKQQTIPSDQEQEQHHLIHHQHHHQQQQAQQQQQQKLRENSPDSLLTLSSTSTSGVSSPSLSNSLSCSPSTSESEFDALPSEEGSFEEQQHLQLRRICSTTLYTTDLSGKQVSDEDGLDTAKTPTRLSILRPAHFDRTIPEDSELDGLEREDPLLDATFTKSRALEYLGTELQSLPSLTSAL